MSNRAAFHRNNNAGKAVVSRGKRSITFDNGDGTKSSVITIAPLHKGTGPFTQADEIDTQWQAVGGAWQYEFSKSDFLVQARDTFNVGGLFQFTDPVSGGWVQFDPQSLNWTDETRQRQQIAIKQAVSAVPNDYILNFPSAYGTGIDFRYEAHTTRLGKFLSIDSLARLPTPILTGNNIWLELEFTLATSSGVDIYLDDVLWTKTNGQRIQTTNRIEFRDQATGQTVLWRLDFPRAIDSEENDVVGQFEVRRDGGPSNLFITVRIPKSWIDSAIFPINIDPTTVYSTAGDGHCSSPSVTAWDTVHDATSGNFNYTNGTCIQSVYYDGAGGWGITRQNFPFDTSSIPDTDVISSAEINLYHTVAADNDDNDGNDFITVVESTQASPTSLEAGDYDNYGTTELIDSGDRIDYGSLTVSAYNTVTLNSAGIAVIDKTGYSMFGLWEGHDFLDIPTDQTGQNRCRFATSEATGTSTDPYLYITHSAPADALTATGISTTPVSGTPIFTGVVALTATGISTTPVSGTPTLTASGTQLDQEHYQWFNDDGVEGSATAAANEDTGITIAEDTIVRLRIQIDASGDPDNNQYQLEFKKVGDSVWKAVS